MSQLKITGFTAAPTGWRVVWLDPDCEPAAMVVAPLAGWVTGINEDTDETVIEAATHCAGLSNGTAPSTPWIYPDTDATESPGGVWKILGPGESLPSAEDAAAEAERRLANYQHWQQIRRDTGGAA